MNQYSNYNSKPSIFPLHNASFLIPDTYFNVLTKYFAGIKGLLFKNKEKCLKMLTNDQTFPRE